MFSFILLWLLSFFSTLSSSSLNTGKKKGLTFALWFWNQTWTIRTLSPVSFARCSRTWKEEMKEMMMVKEGEKDWENTQNIRSCCLKRQVKWKWKRKRERERLTFLHGFGLVSKEALNALLWAVVRIVLGLLGPLLPSCLGTDDVVVGVIGAEEAAEGADEGTGLLWLLDDGITAFSPVKSKRKVSQADSSQFESKKRDGEERVTQWESRKEFVMLKHSLTCLTRDLYESHFFFKVRPTKKSSRPNDKLISLLQLSSTCDARKTRQVIDVVQGSHDKFWGRNRFQATCALCCKQPVKRWTRDVWLVYLRCFQ